MFHEGPSNSFILAGETRENRWVCHYSVYNSNHLSTLLMVISVCTGPLCNRSAHMLWVQYTYTSSTRLKYHTLLCSRPQNTASLCKLSTLTIPTRYPLRYAAISDKASPIFRPVHVLCNSKGTCKIWPSG